ncbi:conserved hypothetical protein [Uncinocarpus reesii 1704]|uniref:VLRF1 domain-containing protein n=1 Tax=Uncinocarpus reesii (strain UAMH 1704) TaxID=336963 RepID=C4JN04_UNCRE|nr:uncharacterized protein UREG_04212 [Uncinocarpus reesii 1704]EEP79366.1 conserved hypothetical protein [Uncinocarpus reesii 1704]
MAATKQNPQELLQRPLYVFDLPAELLATLSRRETSGSAPEPEQQKLQDPSDQGEAGAATSTSCSLCQVSFENVGEQRDHVRSDHHRYNLKSRVRGNAPLNESEFNRAIGELDESISGSDSESSDEEEGGQKTPDNTLVALLKRQAKLSAPELEHPIAAKHKGARKQPIVWFTSSLIPSTTYLGVYRALFTDAEQDGLDNLVSALREKQVKSVVRHSNKAPQNAPLNNAPRNQAQKYFLCMIGGGHFAAMIVSAASEINKNASGLEERKPTVIAHRSFHRYTTRRKQGGSQSANDAAKGAAHSAGSSLRRYNEAALEKEIRDLLKDWREMIDTSELLFVRASGTTNRRILFGAHEGQVLKPSDTRLRSIPFTTRRATQAELLRAFAELSRVKVSQFDEATLAKEQEKYQEAAARPSKPLAAKQKPKISKDEEEAMLHTSQIQALIRRSKVPALLSYFSNNAIAPSFKFHSSASQPIHRCPTPLHLAANSNAAAIVKALLTKAGADPTLLNAEERPAFDLAGDRPTRDAFRIARHELGEASWDWEAAHVPSAMSQEDVDSQTGRDKEAAAQSEAQRRREALERLRKEDASMAAQQRKPLGRTPASQKSAAEKREEETRGMTPEMRMRLERERRARAAEERIRRMQAG